MAWANRLLAALSPCFSPNPSDEAAAAVVDDPRVVQPPFVRDEKPAHSPGAPASLHDEEPGEIPERVLSPRTERFLEEQGSDYLPDKLYERVPGRRTLGTGGFGVVHICRQADNHAVLVAIKNMRYSEDNAQNLRMDRALEKEIRHLKLCRHPNILTYLGLTRDEYGGVGIVCHYAANKSLPTYLKENRHADRYKILREVAAGLAYLHYPSPSIVVDGKSIRIVHGDIHPGNVLIMGDGTAVLGDFGLSKMASEGFAVSMTARAGGADGVSEYLAPEVHRLDAVPEGVAAVLEPLAAQEPEYAGRRTDKSDVFAFGMLTFTTFRGRGAVVPALGTGAAATAALIRGTRPGRGDAAPAPEEGKESGRPDSQPASSASDGDRSNRIAEEPLPLDDSTWTVVCECWQARASRRPTMNDVRGRL